MARNGSECVVGLENACGGSGMCNGSQQWALVSKMGARCWELDGLGSGLTQKI